MRAETIGRKNPSGVRLSSIGSSCFSLCFECLFKFLHFLFSYSFLLMIQVFLCCHWLQDILLYNDRLRRDVFDRKVIRSRKGENFRQTNQNLECQQAKRRRKRERADRTNKDNSNHILQLNPFCLPFRPLLHSSYANVSHIHIHLIVTLRKGAKYI